MSVITYFDPSEATAHVDSLLLRYLGRLKESELEEAEALQQTEIQHSEVQQQPAPKENSSRFSETMLKEALIDMKEEIDSLQIQLDQALSNLRSDGERRQKVNHHLLFCGNCSANRKFFSVNGKIWHCNNSLMR